MISFDAADSTESDTIMGGSEDDTIIMNNGDFADGGAGDDAIEVQNSANQLFAMVWASIGSDDLVVRNQARARFNDNMVLSKLMIEDQARLSADTDGDIVLRTRFLSLAPTAQLDLADNALILDYNGSSPIDSMRALLQSGHAGGAWNGPGIASSSAAARPSPLPLSQSTGRGSDGVGFAESADLFSSFPAVFAGQAVDDSSLLIRYTRNGDANLNGTVDIADFSRLAAQFNTTTNRWSAGDFNYDGVTGFADFAQLAAGFGQTVLRGIQPLTFGAIELAQRTSRAVPVERGVWSSIVDNETPASR